MVKGPFLTLKEAAKYCGYSVHTFRKLVAEYDIPRFGPKKNRFAQSILDEWMANPDLYKPEIKRIKYRHKKIRLVSV